MNTILFNEKGRPLCTFLPLVEELRCLYLPNGETVGEVVKFRLKFEDGEISDPFFVPLLELDSFDWEAADRRCTFYPDVPRSTVRKHLQFAIRKSLSHVSERTVYRLDHVGLYTIDREHVFCTGQEVIRPPADPNDTRPEIELRPIDQHLDVDPALSEAEAVSEMLRLIALNANAGRIILAQKLLYLMRQAFVDAGKAPCVCVFLYGRTGMKKTTFSSFLTQTYNRSRGIDAPPRLNASIPAAVNLLLNTHDDVTILDDLFPADSTQIRSQQEQTLIELTRYVGDGTTPARMRGKNAAVGVPTCGILFTGEYVIGTGSDAARILPVEMAPLDGEKLRYFQERPLIVSTFYWYFLIWAMEHYDKIVEWLKKWLNCYREKNFGVHARLQETHYFLSTAYALLLQYCIDKDVLSDQDAQQLGESFRTLLTLLIFQQDRRVTSSCEKPESVDYLARIRSWYRSNRFTIAASAKQFDKEVHDGVIHLGKLYLRGDALAQCFPGIDIHEIVDALRQQGALDVGKGSPTKQISSLNGLRFYVIFLHYLS